MVFSWTFNGFEDDQGRNVMDDWYDSLPPVAQNKLDWILGIFETRSNAEWGGTKFFKPYTGYKDVWEFRWEIGDTWYRPLGVFGPDRQVFTFLIGTTKKRKGVLIPKNAAEIALKRWDIIKNNPARSKECEF
jgi:hypothetical protein